MKYTLIKQLMEAAVTPYQKPTESLSLDEIQKLLEGPCSNAWDAYQNDDCIYRGARSEYKINVYDPSTGTRKSQNTGNYYTLFFDTNPANHAWPKRSKSFICSTDKRYAAGFGIVHCIFPFNGVDLAACPYRDMWESGYYSDLDIDGIGFLPYDELNTLVDIVAPGVETYQEFTGKLLNFDQDAFITLLKTTKSDLATNVADAVSKIDEFEFYDFLQGWANSYTFSNGGFELVDNAHNISDWHEDREVWFSGKCLIIPEQYMGTVVAHMHNQVWGK